MINWQDLGTRIRTAKMHGQAIAAASSAREAAREVEALSRTLEQMQQRLDKMSMVLMAMVALLQNKLNLREEELFAHLESVVQLIEQHRATASEPSRCPKCQSAVPPEAKRCQFCGAEVPLAKPPNTLEELLM